MSLVSERVFKKFDKDNSGSINRWEFGSLVAELGYHLSAEELDLAVKKLDKDGGGISLKEFQAWWREDDRFAKLQLSDEQLARMKQAQAYFNHFDKDHSGTISRAEFASLHADLVKHKYRIPASLEDAIQQLDSDNSGQISFNEFVRYLGGDGW